MHRRALLKTALALPACAATSADVKRGKAWARRVVVIGAGLAGLAAAQALQRAGFEVVVLEARQRIGGRIHTSHDWPGMPLDLGASWIHGAEGNPLTALADAVQARRRTTRYARAATYGTAGPELNAEQEARLAWIRKQVSRALRAAGQQQQDQSVRQAVASLARQLQGLESDIRMLEFILSSTIEQEYSGSTDILSAHHFDSVQTFGGDDVLFSDGFDVITQHLAQGLRIELGQAVQEIHWSEPDTRIVTQQAHWSADAVVVTLPLGVLKKSHEWFQPALPPAHRQAIDRLGVGVLNKCYMRFPRAFWPTQHDWLEYIPKEPGAWTEWVSLHRATGHPVLLGFNAADRGRTIETLSDERIVASAMSTLRTLFGKAIPEPLDALITRWASDPYALGSYSCNILGATPAMRARLAAPLAGRLYFAGEATEVEQFGTAHGAYTSGLRAAQELMQS